MTTKAAYLQENLKPAGITPWGWIVNSSLAAATTTQPILQKRAQSEQAQIAKVRDELSTRYAVVAMQANEPVGSTKLQALCAVVRPATAA